MLVAVEIGTVTLESDLAKFNWKKIQQTKNKSQGLFIQQLKSMNEDNKYQCT